MGSMQDMSQLRSLFSACDVKGSGQVDLEDFTAVCKDLGLQSSQIRPLFRKLDMDRDGLINFQDFSAGFEEVSQVLNQSAYHPPPAWEEEEEMDRRLGGELGHLTSDTREQLLNVYQNIQDVSIPGLLEQYEKLISNMSQDFRAQRLNIEKLESVLKRTEENTSLQIAELEEDLHLHWSKMEKKIREEEQYKLEVAIQERQVRHESEIVDLQATIIKLEKHEEEQKVLESKEESTRFKNQILDLSQENEFLRRNLLDTQTKISLLQTELDKLKNDFTDQKMHYERENDVLKMMIDDSREYGNKIQLLNEANKSLYDNNDSMRSALSTFETERKRHSSPNHGEPPVITYSRFLAEDDPCARFSHVATWANKCLDTRVSLPRSHGYSDVESCPSEFGSDRSNSSEEPWLASASYVNSDGEALETRSEIDGRLRWTPSRPVSRSGSSASSKRRLPVFTPKKEGVVMDEGSQTSVPIYRLVLAGDAGSGKSSFLLRLCLNEFRGDIPTTLGVDFQMKKLLVDGDHTTLQIWDTAGQERFRSIAKSYFRKAHGVLLMYDITSESSFINVRQWIDEIKNSSDKPIPMMLIGNKSDMKAEGKAATVIHTSMGEKLAMAYGALFCETSAKNGTNVVEAVLHLAREVKKSVDVTEENANTVTKLSIPEKKTNCCKM